MRTEFLTDEQVDEEVERLKASELVTLGRKAENLKNKKRQYMYQLRRFEKIGAELSSKGITLESIEQELEQMEDIKE